MKVYTPDIKVPDETIKNSIFLAGPTPRNRKNKSWRSDALEILIQLNFKGSVFVPEMFGVEEWNPVYSHQIEWEYKALRISHMILFWVPRDIAGGMPAFTTNVEFGLHLDDDRMIYGRPEWADKCKYLDYMYKKFTGEVPFTDLKELLEQSIKRM